MIKRRVAGWAESWRAVGSALLDVWSAELEALRRELGGARRELAVGLALAGVAAGMLFWSLGLGIWEAVELLALRLERWQAVLVVFAAGLLATVVLAWLARRRLRRIEPPLEMVRRHGREHVEWWRQEVLPGLEPGFRRGGDSADGDEEEASEDEQPSD